MADKSAREKLFSPFRINGLELRNRFIRSATHEFMGSEDGFVTDRLIKLYETLASGEIGLIITGFAYVHPTGKSTRRQMAIADDKFIPGLRKLTEAVHNNHGKLVVQIVHGGRQSPPELCGGVPLAPSAVEDKSVGVTPKEMTPEEIEEITQSFIQAIKRAKEAKFDGVQLHCAHGFLLSEFISPHTNRRKDKWGGNTRNHTRIILDIIRGTKNIIDDNFPLMAKLNSEDFIPGGLTVPESVEVAKLLAKAGIAMIEVSGGMREAGAVTTREGIDSPEKEAYFGEAARQIKAEVACPVAVVGGIRSLGVMERLLNERICDLISLSRPFIREPDLVVKLRKGASDQAKCLSCNKCSHPHGIRCAEEENLKQARAK